MSTETDNGGIETLQKLSASLLANSSAVEAVRITDPLDAAENSYAQFAQDSFACFEEERGFERSLRETLDARQSEATWKELAQVYLETHEKNTLRMERLINPFANLAIAKQASRAQHIPSSGNRAASDIIYDGASKDVLQGVVQLTMLIGKLTEAKETGEKIRVVNENNPQSDSSTPSS